MAKRDFAFGKENFILIAVAVAVIAIGFMLMSGGDSQDPTGFNPEIFSSRRIVVAPAVTVIGRSAVADIWLSALLCSVFKEKKIWHLRLLSMWRPCLVRW